MTAAPIASPCIKLCVVDPVSSLCIGCGRTLEEIAAWGGMSDSDRLAVLSGLETRLLAMRSRKARAGRAGGRRRDR